MLKITIDGKEIIAKENETILNTAERNGIYIPRYCYHPSLSISGNCRMCLVEVEKMPKLQIACATQVSEGMKIYTQNEKIKKARQDILEFLLINHPLDCPICDQVGECYLQDYYMEYGLKKSRIDLKDKNNKSKRIDIGKHLVLDNERCILCTRCVRFFDEITKTSELFINSRGDHSYIDIKPKTKIKNNYSLNVSDLCPVGAFTSKDFRFKERVYNLKSVSSICTSCATGCKIKIQHNNNKIYRIIPEPNIYTNTWICDIGRMAYKIIDDNDRLSKSIINFKEYHIREAILKIFELIKEFIDKKYQIAVILSNKFSIEDNYWLYYFATNLLKTNMIFAQKETEQKIEDGILINSDKTPNNKSVKQMKEIFKLKDVDYLKNFDIAIGFLDDLKQLNIQSKKQIAFSYKNDKTLENLIAIKTYFETEGSFINWQSYLRKTKSILEFSKDTTTVSDFVLKISNFFSIYPEEGEVKKIFELLKYKTED